MSAERYQWTIPFMRAGYAGRGVTYAAIAGLSLWSIWAGGRAQGTSSTLETLHSSALGWILLGMIAIGLIAYCVWRILNASLDLEAYGTDVEGLLARTGMVVTGLIHAAFGVIAFALLFGQSSGGGNMSTLTQRVFEMPMGRIVVGAGAIATIGAGLYYLKKAIREEYRDDLRANHFTVNWNWALKAGVLAQGIIVTIVGSFFLLAALTYNASEAGGMGQVFSWLSSQPFGQLLVIAICAGLAGFALFCFVNAAYRIIPRAASDDVEKLASKLKAKAGA